MVITTLNKLKEEYKKITYNFLKIQKIEDDTVIFQDKIVGILKVHLMNNEIFNEDQLFQLFCHSKYWIDEVDSEIQITTNTSNVNAEEIVKHVLQQTLATYKSEQHSQIQLEIADFNEFQEWFIKFIEEKVKPRRYIYIVIPVTIANQETSTIKKAKILLSQRLNKFIKLLQEYKISYNISIDELERRFNEYHQNGMIISENGSYSINLKELNYMNLTSYGEPTKKYNIKTNYYSKEAGDKIKKIGGTIEGYEFDHDIKLDEKIYLERLDNEAILNLYTSYLGKTVYIDTKPIQGTRFSQGKYITSIEWFEKYLLYKHKKEF